MTAIPIIVFDIKKNKYYQMQSISHASRHFKVDIACIREVLKDEPKYRQAGGYCFCYDCENFKEVIAHKLSRKVLRGSYKSKKVVATDTYGNSETYDSVSEAASYLGLTKSSVSRCCRGEQKNSDFKFTFLN